MKVTDFDGQELSDRWSEARQMAGIVRDIWERAA